MNYQRFRGLRFFKIFKKFMKYEIKIELPMFNQN